MSDEVCTSAEAISALGYLRHSFGGWDFQPQEERSHLRTFAKYSTDEVLAAIESLKGQQRRPSPSDIEGAVLAERKATRKASGPYLNADDPELTPPDVVPERVAELRDPNSELRQVPA